jgi:signal peptidase I
MTTIVTISIVFVIAGLGFVWARARWLILTVQGESMDPTLKDGQRIVARKVRRHPRGRRDFGRNDIVVFRLSERFIRRHDSANLPLRVKRITSIEGDPMPDWAQSHSWANGSTHVPQGKVLVLGDKANSQGSPQLGFIDAASIIAVVRAPAEAAS